VKQEVWSIDPVIAYLDSVRLATIRACRLDSSVDAERRADPERIPGAVGVPPPIPRKDSVWGRDGRERVRHPDRTRVPFEHERMLVVQEPPSVEYVSLVSELTRGRRATELNEGRIRPVAKIVEIRVDAATL
jgi:hypothetical protein